MKARSLASQIEFDFRRRLLKDRITPVSTYAAD